MRSLENQLSAQRSTMEGQVRKDLNAVSPGCSHLSSH